MIGVENLHFAYGAESVLRGIDLEVRGGEVLSILGPNGCGKSTLLLLLRGLLTPARGRILWEGRDVTRLGRRAIARLAAVVPQSAPIPFPYPVREVVAMGRYAHESGFLRPSPRGRKAVERAMETTDTLHLAGRPVTDLSGGEFQRVLLARALAQETPVLLLDEATSHLDLDHRLKIAEMLVRLNREHNTTVVQVSHDLDLAAETSDRLLLLCENGAAAALGAPAEVLTPANLRQVFKVEAKVETNPYSGAPRVCPLGRFKVGQNFSPRVHVLCGGGSGGELIRRLHAAGCEITVGPLNRGDSDEALARALGLDMALEEAFCPISPDTLRNATELCLRAEALVVAPTVWGVGNLCSLELAHAALVRNIPVCLIDPQPKRDYTGGKAWRSLQEIMAAKGQAVPDVEAVQKLLESRLSPAKGY
jgi:iron complex transport system ATP-binding protein